VVNILQLEYAADESILCVSGSNAAVPKLLSDFLFSLSHDFNYSMTTATFISTSMLLYGPYRATGLMYIFIWLIVWTNKFCMTWLLI